MHRRLAVTAALLSSLLGAAPARARPTLVAAPAVADTGLRLDVNQLGIALPNDGHFAMHAHFTLNLEYPPGSGNDLFTAGGLWLSAFDGANPHLALAEFASVYRPGVMIGTRADDPTRSLYRTLMLRRHYRDPVVRDAELQVWANDAEPDGAPHVSVLANGDLDIRGDEMTWCVFNDADTTARVTDPRMHTPAIGVEVRELAWAHAGPPPLDRTVFVEYQIRNRSGADLPDLAVGIWSDVDLGVAEDDLVGLDLGRSLGFVYNGTDADMVYGAAAPAVGIDLLQGPHAAGGGHLGLTAYLPYLHAQDFSAPAQPANLLRGRWLDGSTVIDPTTSSPTTYRFTGDPIAGTGWLDTLLVDKRILLVSGPSALADGAADTVRFALVVGQGADRLASLVALRASDDLVQSFADGAWAVTTVDTIGSSYDTAVHLHWRLGGATPGSIVVERSVDGGPWTQLVTQPGSLGSFDLADDATVPGHTYAYRLRLAGPAGPWATGEMQVVVPPLGLSIREVRPNPGSGDRVQLTLALPARGPVEIEVFDLGGRRVSRQEVDALAAGIQAVALDVSGLRNGVYLVRATQAGRRTSARLAIIR